MSFLGQNRIEFFRAVVEVVSRTCRQDRKRTYYYLPKIFPQNMNQRAKLAQVPLFSYIYPCCPHYHHYHCYQHQLHPPLQNKSTQLSSYYKTAPRTDCSTNSAGVKFTNSGLSFSLFYFPFSFLFILCSYLSIFRT